MLEKIYQIEAVPAYGGHSVIVYESYTKQTAYNKIKELFDSGLVRSVEMKEWYKEQSEPLVDFTQGFYRLFDAITH